MRKGTIRKVPIMPLAVFLLLAAGVAIGSVLLFSTLKQNFRARAKAEFRMIADLKSSQIAEWRRSQEIHGAALQSNPLFVWMLQTGFHANPRMDTGALNNVFAFHRKNVGWTDAMVLDAALQPRLAFNRPLAAPAADALTYCRQALSSRKAVLGDIARDPATGRLYIGLFIPVSVSNQPPGALIVARLNPAEYLFPFIQSWPVPSATAETLLLRREGEQGLYLNELRHRTNTALNLRFPLQGDDRMGARILRNEPGASEGYDYRKQRVLGAVRWVPGSNWALVAKADADEIYAPLRRIELLMWVGGGVLIGALGLVMLLWWNRLKLDMLKSQLLAGQKEKALLQNFEYLTKYANDIVTLGDEGGKYLWVNERAVQVYGYSHEEFLGMHVTDLRAPGYGMPLSEFLANAHASDGLSFETRHRRKDGTLLDVEVSVRMIRIDERTLLQAIVRDITARKRAEEQVRRLNAELEERVRLRTAQLEIANKELDAFAYSVSHDLRAPLRGIAGFSKVIQEDCADQLGDQGREYLKKIQAASQRMGELIDDLLHLSRVTRHELRMEAVDLSRLAHEIVPALQHSQPDRVVEFVIAPELRAYGDPKLLRIVLENLLGNAWKYTGKRAAARIEFGRDERNGEPVFFVRDDGAGFDMTYVHKLFGAFQRLHGTAEFEGNGIGLATVARIIHRHGGKTWAEGAVEQGATFYFTLGAQRPAAGETQTDVKQTMGENI